MKLKADQFSATSPNPVLRVDKDGTVLYSNESGKILLHEWGVEVGEKLPSSVEELVLRVISRNSPEKMEVKVGKKVYLTVFHPFYEEKCVCISGFDINDQKALEEKVQESEAQEMANVDQQEREIEVAFLSLLNERKRTAELVHSAVSFFRERFGLEAIGLRLQESYDYPYFETSGFPEEFVRMENSLCARDEAGQPIFDNAGNPIKECMCGSVICGRFDPLKPFFTARGSFWTNSTTELLAANTVADRQARMCNRCNGIGYESVALIALRVDDDILGLLQLNDTRRDQFSPSTIRMWERLAGYLAMALAKARVEELLLEAYETLLIQSEKLTVQSEELQKANEALRESEEKYRNIIETANEGIFLISTEFKISYANKKTAEMLGYTLEEIIGRPVMDFVHEESKPTAERNLEKRLHGINENYELKLMCKDGSLFWVLICSKPLFNKDGDFTGSLCMFSDITKRKEAETKLKETLDNLENLVEERTAELETAFNSLKKSGKTLAEAQKIAHIGSWEWDILDDKAYWSDEMYRIFGRSPQDLAPNYEEFLNYIAFEDRDYVINAFKEGPRREPYFIEFRIVLDTGEERTVHMQSETVFEGDTPVLMKGTVQDITERTRSEEKIRNLANIVESSNDAIGTISPEGIITSWNKGAEQVYGYSAEEVLGKFVSIAAPPHLSDETKKLSERIKQGENINNYETVRLRKDGKIIDVSMTISPVFGSRGKMTAISFISRDFTERKTVEEKNKMLADVVESSNDAIGTLSLDGIITSWNKGAEQIYGYSAEEVLGKPTSIAAPAHLTDETKKLSERIKQGESIHHYETLRLRKDGKIIDVSITLSPVFDSHGKMTAISFISRDFTERKAVEEKLRESEEKYRNIVETANEGILIIDNEALIIYANKKLAAMSGYTLEEIIGRPIWDFLIEESKAIVKLNLKNRRLGIDDSYEFQVIRKDSSPLWVFSNAKSLFDKDGRFIGSLSMLTDITKRKEAEQALANFEIAREKEIYHRIKNNLQVVSSLLDLQAYKFKGRSDIKDSEVIDAFMESQNRVASMALIHEELYKGGGLETINFSVYMEKLADNLLSTYVLGNNDISLNKDLEEDIFLDMDTAIPLGTIINELVSNSFKYAFPDRDRGEIRIKLHREEGDLINIREESKCEDPKSTNIILSVSDNGVGIPKNLDIENLDSLGLQLVTSLVEQIGGELEIKRNNGTEFIICFNVTEKNNKASATVPNNYSEPPKFLH